MTMMDAGPRTLSEEAVLTVPFHGGGRQIVGTTLSACTLAGGFTSGGSVLDERLRGLRGLRPGWDGEGGLAPDRHVMARVAALVADPRIRRMRVAAQLVPDPDGGVLVEWHSELADLVLEFLPDGSLEAYVRDLTDGYEGEGHWVEQQRKIVDVLNLLS